MTVSSVSAWNLGLLFARGRILTGNLHRDTADRVLFATARAREMTIKTRDKITLN